VGQPSLVLVCLWWHDLRYPTCVLLFNGRWIADECCVIAIYIPGFNTKVFYQSPIDWEWGIVAGLSLVFVIYCELWKLARPIMYKRWEEPLQVLDVEQEITKQIKEEEKARE